MIAVAMEAVPSSFKRFGVVGIGFSLSSKIGSSLDPAYTTNEIAAVRQRLKKNRPSSVTLRADALSPMIHRAVALVLMLGWSNALAGCHAPKASTNGMKPVAAADAKISPGEQVHVWVSPKPTQCPDATLPAPGQTPPEETARRGQLVRRMKPAFRTCFERFMDRHPWSSGGRVRLELGVDCEGRVTRMRAAAGNIDRAMAACLMRVALATRFDPPSAGIGIVSIPMTFKP
jgi:hypothetical protein